SFSNSRTILANFLLGLRIVPEVVGTKRRLRARWAVAILGPTIALAVAVLSLQAHARHPTIGTPSEATAAAAMFALPDAGVPEDVVVRQELERAIDLRRREDFDRVLDARDEGELIEHATLTDGAFDHHDFAPDALFVVGDELFGYPFRPENGWGHAGADRKAIGYTPELRRVHDGLSGGPDAFGCFSCHSKGGPDGGGTQTQNAFMRGDGDRTG